MNVPAYVAVIAEHQAALKGITKGGCAGDNRKCTRVIWDLAWIPPLTAKIFIFLSSRTEPAEHTRRDQTRRDLSDVPGSLRRCNT